MEPVRGLRAAELARYNQYLAEQAAALPETGPTPPELISPGASQLTRGLERGYQGVKSTLQGAGAAVQDLYDPEGAARNYAEAAANMERVQRNNPLRVEQFTDIGRTGGVGDWAAGAIGQGLPTMGTALVGGLAGRTGLAGLRSLATRAGRPGVSRALSSDFANTAAGMGAGIFPQEVGEQALNFQADPVAMENTTPLSRLGLNVGKGVVTSAAESVVPMYTIGRLGKTATAGVGRGWGNAAANVGKTTGTGMAGEALTEGAQNVIGDVTQMIANPAHEIDPQAALNAAAAGAVTGGVMSGGAGAVQAARANLGAAPTDDVTAPPTVSDKAADVVTSTLDKAGEVMQAVKEKAQTHADKVGVKEFTKEADFQDLIAEHDTSKLTAEEYEQYADGMADRANGFINKLKGREDITDLAKDAGYLGALHKDVLDGVIVFKQKMQAAQSGIERDEAVSEFRDMLRQADRAKKFSEMAASVPTPKASAMTPTAGSTGATLAIMKDLVNTFPDVFMRNDVQTIDPVTKLPITVDKAISSAKAGRDAALKALVRFAEAGFEIEGTGKMPITKEMRIALGGNVPAIIRRLAQTGLANGLITTDIADKGIQLADAFEAMENRAPEAREDASPEGEVQQVSDGRTLDSDTVGETPNEDIAAGATSAMHPSVLEASVKFKGPFDTGFVQHGQAMKRVAKQAQGRGAAVKRVGIVDFIESEYKTLPREEIDKKLEAVVAKYARLIPPHASADPLPYLNKRVLMLKLESASDKLEPIDIPGEEFAVVSKNSETAASNSKNVWGINAQDTSPEKGVLFFERANVDGTTTTFPVFGGKIIHRMRQAMLDTESGTNFSGPEGQLKLLTMGISSFTNSKNEDGMHALSGRVGIKPAGSKDVVWLNEDGGTVELPNEFKLPSGTVKQARKITNAKFRKYKQAAVANAIYAAGTGKEVMPEKLDMELVPFMNEGELADARESLSIKVNKVKDKIQNDVEAERDTSTSKSILEALNAQIERIDEISNMSPNELRAARNDSIYVNPKSSKDAKINPQTGFEEETREGDIAKGGARTFNEFGELVQKPNDNLSPSQKAAWQEAIADYNNKKKATAQELRAKQIARLRETLNILHKGVPATKAAMKQMTDKQRENFKALLEVMEKAKTISNPLWKDVPGAPSVAAGMDKLQNTLRAALGKGGASEQPPDKTTVKSVRENKVILPKTSPFTAKDQAKSDKATKFIGRGSAKSSTAAYAKAWGDRANSGKYTAEDVVFVSAEGDRAGRKGIDTAELQKAIDASATIITDDTANRNRNYNVGEREVADYLNAHGYIEEDYGVWEAMDEAPDSGVGDIQPEPKYSEQTPAKEMSDAEVQKIVDEHKRVMGTTIALEMKKEGLTADGKPISGTWVDKLITISMFATDPKGTLRHEHVHQLFKWLADAGSEATTKALKNLGTNEIVLERLRVLLADHPDAVKQLKDPEEAAAYAYQFWNARKEDGRRMLELGPKSETFLGKVSRVLRNLFRIPSNNMIDQEAANKVFEALYAGNFANKDDAAMAVIEAAMEKSNSRRDRGNAIMKGLVESPFLQKAVYSNFSVLKDSGSKHLEKLSDKFWTPHGQRVKAGEQDVLTAIKQNSGKFGARMGEAYKKLSSDRVALREELKLAAGHLNGGTPLGDIKHEGVKEFVKTVRKLLSDVHDYASERGVSRLNEKNEWVKMGKIEDNYYARSFDRDYLSKHVEEFKKKLLERHPDRLDYLVQQAEAERNMGAVIGKFSASSTVPLGTPITREDIVDAITTQLLNTNGDLENPEAITGVGITPYASAVNKRSLNWLDRKVFAEYMGTDVVATMSNYIHQMVKRAEMTKAFGHGGEQVKRSLDRAFAEKLLGSNEKVDEIEKEADEQQKSLMDKYGYSATTAAHHTAFLEQMYGKTTPELKADYSARELRKNALTQRLAQLNKEHDRAVGWHQMEVAESIEQAEYTQLMMKIEQGDIQGELDRRGKEGDATRIESKKKTVRALAADRLKGSDKEKQESILEVDKWMKAQENAVMAMEGTLGREISDTMRTAAQTAMAYQNIRLLPLTLFTSLTDPSGLVVRGGEMKDALRAFGAGLKAVSKSWSNEIPEMDLEASKAAYMGLLDVSSVISKAGEIAGSMYAGNSTIRKINDTFFRLNGMEAWNRAMRSVGSGIATNFITNHLQNPTEHSERLLKDIGIDPAQKDGYFLKKDLMDPTKPASTTDRALWAKKGELDITNPHVQQAVMRWVDGAILNPNAAHRPTLASDPRFALFYQYKQFVYTFHNTIIRHMINEARHGNYSPMAIAIATYVPIIVAADFAKAMLTSGGEEPAWSRSLGGIIEHGFDRSGLGGVSQMIASDLPVVGKGEPTRSLGPTIDQIIRLSTAPFDPTLSTSGEMFASLPAGNVFRKIADKPEEPRERNSEFPSLLAGIANVAAPLAGRVGGM